MHTSANIALLLLVLAVLACPKAEARGIKLNAPLASGQRIIGFKTSPDSRWVIYRVYRDSNSVAEIYSVPITGGTAVKLNSEIGLNAMVMDDFIISPDSSRVVFRVYYPCLYCYSSNDIYSVPIGGGNAVRLNSQSPYGGSLLPSSIFMISPDSSRVIFAATQDTNMIHGNTPSEVFSIPITGGVPVRLNGPLVAGRNASPVQIGPDSSRVVYRADQDTDDVFELYSVSIGGGEPVKLNAELPASGDVGPSAISSEGQHVVYRADLEMDEVYGIYSVPIGGGTSVKLNEDCVSGGDVQEFRISPDGQRVIYQANQDAEDVIGLYSVAIGGGDVTRLTADIGDIWYIGGWKISPDSSRVVYIADLLVDMTYELFSVGITGLGRVKLNVQLAGDVTDFCISPRDDNVVYRADQEVEGNFNFYSVPLTGGTPVRLNDPMLSVESARYDITPRGDRVIYIASDDSSNEGYLYTVSIRGGLPTLITSDGFSTSYIISNNGRRLVFWAKGMFSSVSISTACRSCHWDCRN